ncbi:MAG: hypothetical protein AAB921_02980 [Patescibacteria group bacterium]
MKKAEVDRTIALAEDEKHMEGRVQDAMVACEDGSVGMSTHPVAAQLYEEVCTRRFDPLRSRSRR